MSCARSTLVARQLEPILRTDAANTGIKQIKRTSRGDRNPAHYQARILLTSAARRAA